MLHNGAIYLYCSYKNNTSFGNIYKRTDKEGQELSSLKGGRSLCKHVRLDRITFREKLKLAMWQQGQSLHSAHPPFPPRVTLTHVSATRTTSAVSASAPMEGDSDLSQKPAKCFLFFLSYFFFPFDERVFFKERKSDSISIIKVSVTLGNQRKERNGFLSLYMLVLSLCFVFFFKYYTCKSTNIVFNA